MMELDLGGRYPDDVSAYVRTYELDKAADCFTVTDAFTYRAIGAAASTAYWRMHTRATAAVRGTNALTLTAVKHVGSLKTIPMYVNEPTNAAVRFDIQPASQDKEVNRVVVSFPLTPGTAQSVSVSLGRGCSAPPPGPTPPGPTPPQPGCTDTRYTDMEINKNVKAKSIPNRDLSLAHGRLNNDGTPRSPVLLRQYLCHETRCRCQHPTSRSLLQVVAAESCGDA